ncbi:MAG TPA: bifunctional DNA primase/polymerase [Acidimicrobiia bacterium]|nr:bifunctional DNA primase/polymerase [Acidimicrobiia bacterium]
MIDHAIGYAQKGWEILPLRGKIPAISKRAGGNGVLDATSDLEQVAAWWDRYPKANIGARVPAGVIVTDTDPRTNPNVDDDLRDAAGELPDTLTAISGRGDGGRHYYWRHPGGNIYTRNLPPGVDVKTHAGYVVLPPSIHPDSGRPYRWVDAAAPIVEAPLRLQLLLAPPPPPKRPKPRRWTSDGDSPADAFTASTTSSLYYGGDPRHRPAPVGFSIKKTGSKTRYLVEKGSAGDQLLASLASPKLARPYTAAGWLVD